LIKKCTPLFVGFMLQGVHALAAGDPSNILSTQDSALPVAIQDCPPLPQLRLHQHDSQLELLYQSHQEPLLWSTGTRVQTLVAALQSLEDDGLASDDYARPQVMAETRDGASPDQAAACFDLHLSSLYLRALEELLHGRVPATQPEWVAEGLISERAALSMLAAASLADPAMAMHRARPAVPEYEWLRQQYRQLRLHPGEWQAVPPGALLRPRADSPRIPALRERLVSGGYLPATSRQSEAPNHYDAELEQALRQFQLSQGLKVDGVLGPDTLSALNRSPSQRLLQLRLNLERLRWLEAWRSPDMLLVNVSGGTLQVIEQGQQRWQTRIQAGRSDRRTPLLVSRLNRVTLNPSWTVPPTIFRKDKLPLIREDVGYIARSDMQVLSSDGKVLDATSIDWTNPGNVLLRQRPGSTNPLGQMAFRFPNPFSVYLHDTPSQHLFERATRSVSSGCVRVEAASQLSDWLFQRLEPARREQVAIQLASGRTHEVSIPGGPRLVLAYWTAEADADGARWFNDPYRLDPELDQALRQWTPRYR